MTNKHQFNAASVYERQRLFRLSTLLLAALVLGLLTSSWMFGEVTVPNERSRVYLSVALVDDGTLSIDEPLRRFGRIIDIAQHDGRHYTDKAPGASLLGAGIYYIARLFSFSADWTITELVNLMRNFLMIPIGLVGFLLLRRFLARQKIGPVAVDIISLGWILGTPAFHYSTAFYGHQIVAVALLASITLIEDAKRSAPKTWAGPLRLAGAGAAAGLAGLTEYQAAIPCVLLLVYVSIGNVRRPTWIAAFVIGAMPFLAVLLAYNWISFGGPFQISYHHLILPGMQSKHDFGIAGVTYPKSQAVLGGLFSLHRGLIPTSPIFLLTLPGLITMWKKGNRLLTALVGVTLLYSLMFVFSAQVWHGSWSFGLRLFVPAMTLAAIPAAYAADRFNSYAALGGLARGLVLAGVLYNQCVHLVISELPETVKNPIIDIVLPALKEGILSPNLVGRFTGRSDIGNLSLSIGLVSIAVLVIVGRGLTGYRGWFKKGVSVLTTFGVVAVLGLAIYLSGPGMGGRDSAKFIKWLKRLDKVEYSQTKFGG
ncbi:MAG: hypothetical protein GY762_22495 [Proteobacteria bacterium]|nr:hypothetical protein [Pseudomonadota bacterium]